MKKRLRRDACSLCALCVLCANPVFQNKHKSVSRRREKKGRLRPDPCSLCALCALCANPVFQNKHKSVSRRREKKGCLRRDARVGYRGVTSGLTSEAHEVSRYAPRAFFFVTRLLGSRHRLAFRTRAVVLHDDNQGDKRKTDQVGRQPRIDQ
ncbi:MAG: hypothetical protein BWX67_00050 [Thermotogae bacterium ADurb.Bin062]|nr:MAG: hypothetical protein BWX67_00050 [Thermotogota bacterium ADurb.Bin062]